MSASKPNLSTPTRQLKVLASSLGGAAKIFNASANKVKRKLPVRKIGHYDACTHHSHHPFAHVSR
jgi:hypothetical protein